MNAVGMGVVGRCSLSFRSAQDSVFAATFFIEEADLSAPDPVVPAIQWQSAAGRRLLSPGEQAARERYFDEKAAAAVAKARRGLHSALGRSARRAAFPLTG